MVSLLLLVVVPYLSRKLEARMMKLKEKLQDEVTSNDKYELLQLYSYRTVKSSYEFAQIIKYVSYLAGYSSSHSISLMVAGISLRHASLIEHPFSWTDVFNGKIGFSTALSTLMLRSLEFGGFFLQFIQWWQDSSSSSSRTIGELPIPEPPMLDENANKYQNICPICLQEFQIPTIVQVSGYVFCYKCITKHFKKHLFCPVTNFPASVDDLVRIYDS